MVHYMVTRISCPSGSHGLCIWCFRLRCRWTPKWRITLSVYDLMHSTPYWQIHPVFKCLAERHIYSSKLLPRLVDITTQCFLSWSLSFILVSSINLEAFTCTHPQLSELHIIYKTSFFSVNTKQRASVDFRDASQGFNKNKWLAHLLAFKILTAEKLISGHFDTSVRRQEDSLLHDVWTYEGTQGLNDPYFKREAWTEHYIFFLCLLIVQPGQAGKVNISSC